MKNYFCLVASIVIAGGCATAPIAPKQIVWPKPVAESATVVGWGHTLKGFLSTSLVATPGIRLTELSVYKANGKRVNVRDGAAVLPPGSYQLELTCNVTLGGSMFLLNPIIEANLSAGHVYALSAHAGYDSCSPELSEVI